MTELVKNLKANNRVIIPNIERPLTIKYIECSNYNTYVILFYGIGELTTLNGDTEVTLL